MIPKDFETRIRRAWQGRISGCMLGKPVEQLSMLSGYDSLLAYLKDANALPLRHYVPFNSNGPEETVSQILRNCCAEGFEHSQADDDINYSVLALLMLEQHGGQLTTESVARAWLTHLPAAKTYTAERAAYRILMSRAHEWFAEGMPPEFDLAECSDNEYNDWIGAQIRADVYGWVCPGNSELAVQLVRTDAELSHRGEGVYGAMVIAAIGAELLGGAQLDEAIDAALRFIPANSECAQAIELAREFSGMDDGAAKLRERYAAMSPVHTVNNLALVIWALSRHRDDFSAAIGDAVAAGWDTDCNGATVGALWSLQGLPVPDYWFEPWNGRVEVSLAGQHILDLEDLVQRTVAVAKQLQ